MDQATRDAFERLLRIAASDTGQARRVANFVLAWWNAEDWGGFDLVDLFNVDRAISMDMARVFYFLATYPGGGIYPQEYKDQILTVIEQWRPDALKKMTDAAES